MSTWMAGGPRLQYGVFEAIFWMIMVIIFIGVCVGIARDCNKLSSSSRSSRARPRSVTTRRPQTEVKRQAHRTQSHTQYAEIQLAMCPECEATILAEATVCPHCNSPQPVCTVCNNSIVPLDSTLSCPHCGGRAHRIHFLEYLKVKGTCPNCRANLDPHELIDDTQGDISTTTSGGPQHICMVCNSAIISTDSALQCPNCEGKAHRVHFLEYLKVKGKCPHCQISLDAQDLTEP